MINPGGFLGGWWLVLKASLAVSDDYYVCSTVYVDSFFFAVANMVGREEVSYVSSPLQELFLVSHRSFSDAQLDSEKDLPLMEGDWCSEQFCQRRERSS
jgi:hypothetical protein